MDTFIKNFELALMILKLALNEKLSLMVSDLSLENKGFRFDSDS